MMRPSKEAKPQLPQQKLQDKAKMVEVPGRLRGLTGRGMATIGQTMAMATIIGTPGIGGSRGIPGRRGPLRARRQALRQPCRN